MRQWRTCRFSVNAIDLKSRRLWSGDAVDDSAASAKIGPDRSLVNIEHLGSNYPTGGDRPALSYPL